MKCEIQKPNHLKYRQTGAILSKHLKSGKNVWILIGPVFEWLGLFESQAV